MRHSDGTAAPVDCDSSSMVFACSASRSAKRVLGPTASAALRDKLIAELRELSSADQSAEWAHRIISSKNRLTPKDAEQLELSFQLKLSTFAKQSPNVLETNFSLGPPPFSYVVGDCPRTPDRV